MANTYPSHHHAAPPPNFDEPTVNTSVRLTTRVYDRITGQIETIQNRVLVKTNRTTPFRDAAGFEVEDIDTDVRSYHSKSSNSSSSSVSTVEDEMNDDSIDQPTHAYLFLEFIMDTIFGHVSLGIILERASPNADWEWERTSEQCVIKEMSWVRVRRGLDQGKSENPQYEIAAMQHLKEFYAPSVDTESNRSPALQMVDQTNIIMPLDTLYDTHNLYIVIPYCEGGDLFERLFETLDTRQHFTEPETRFYILQILDGVESLQRAGLCHRDISLENVMTDRTGKPIIIDMGMCIRIPYFEHEDQRQPSQRRLTRPQGTCGKLPYMSPEIYNSQHAFDGHAVDIWAVGVILHAMLTGEFPWKRPTDLDARFRNRMQGLAEFLSGDALKLLERMFASDPEDRLSLDQIRDHPWMSGPVRYPSV